MSALGPESEASPPSGGLLASVRRMLATLIEILHTRVELFTTELEEEIQGAVRILVWVLGAMFFASITIVMLTITLLVVFWEDHRVLAASLITASFLLLAVGTGLVARRRIRERPRLLSASLEELRRDRAALEERLP